MTIKLRYPTAYGKITEVAVAVVIEEEAPQTFVVALYPTGSRSPSVQLHLTLEEGEVTEQNWTTLVYRAICPDHFEDSENQTAVRITRCYPEHTSVQTGLGKVDFKFINKDESEVCYLSTEIDARKIVDPVIMTQYININARGLDQTDRLDPIDRSLQVSLRWDGLYFRHNRHPHLRAEDHLKTYRLMFETHSRLSPAERVKIYHDEKTWKSGWKWLRGAFTNVNSTAILNRLGEFDHIISTDGNISVSFSELPERELIAHLRGELASLTSVKGSSLLESLRLALLNKLTNILSNHVASRTTRSSAQLVCDLLHLRTLLEEGLDFCRRMDSFAWDNTAPSATHY